MAVRIGIVGYQGSGKSSLFHWLTGEEPDPSLAHSTQMAMATVPDNLGELPRGTLGEATFTLSNGGDEPLDTEGDDPQSGG